MGRRGGVTARMRSVLIVGLLIATVILGGCIDAPGTKGLAEAGRVAEACRTGQYVEGFDSTGAPVCSVPLPAQTWVGFACPSGYFVKGFDAVGKPECGRPLDPSPPAAHEVSSNLMVLNVYGVRNTSSTNLWDIDVNVELSAGALPIDITKLIVRYSDGTTTQNYNYSTSALANGAASNTFFVPTWIRGTGTSAVAQAGDLVQIHYNLHGRTLAPRTSVQLTLLPESGSPVDSDFKSPATYGTDTTITLR
ncbi:MAG: hypothetical protein WDA16_01235 [Candidatus Thermoplasmatota archaeon]